MTRMKNPAHPGRIVASAIKDSGWTITHAAERLGVTRAFLSRILHGHSSITAAMALRLALGWSDEHWMRMQASYDLAKERRRAVLKLPHVGQRHFPISKATLRTQVPDPCLPAPDRGMP